MFTIMSVTKKTVLYFYQAIRKYENMPRGSKEVEKERKQTTLGR